jgi:hypothetical protein
VQFQKLCSEDTVASNRLLEGDGVEYKGTGRERKGTVRFWGEGNAAIEDGRGNFFDDPLVWLYETEDGAYPQNNKDARNAAERKKRSIFCTRDGKERWCPFKTIPTPKDPSKSPSAAGPAPGSSDAFSSPGGGLAAPDVLQEAKVSDSRSLLPQFESSGNGGASSSKEMTGAGPAQVCPPPHLPPVLWPEATWVTADLRSLLSQ